MDKDIMAKAIVLAMQEKMVVIQKSVADSNDFEEIAVAYDRMAELVRTTGKHLDELEKE